MMRSDPRPVPTEQEEEHALLMVREFRGDPAERGPGCHSSLWLLVIAVFLVLAAGNCFGAVWKHQEPAEVAQRAVVSKTATTEDATADTKKDAISTGSEGAAEAVSSSVTLALSGKGVIETPENRKATGDLLKACGSTCLAVTGVATVGSGGAAVPAVAACVPLIVAGSAISAFNDDTLSTKDLSHMMNARFDKLSEKIDKGFNSLTDKLEGLVEDINKDQASKQLETVSTVNEYYRNMWVHIHEDALTEDSLPTQIQISEFRVKLLPTALEEYLQNVFKSPAPVLDVLRAAMGFVAARSQLYTIEVMRCAQDNDGTCQPGLTDDSTKKLDEDLRGYEPIVESWKCHNAVLAAGQEFMTGEQYMQCLPQYLNVDMAASGVAAELKDLPANITHVGGTWVVGNLTDLPASVKYVNVSGYEVVGKLKDLPASVKYVNVSGTEVVGELKDLSASVTYVDVRDTSVVGDLKDLPARVTHVDVQFTSVVGELKDLPASVTHLNVRDTSVVGELKDLPASVTYVDVEGTSVVGELKDLTASVTHVYVGWTSVGGELKDLPASVTHVDVSDASVVGELKDLCASVTFVDVYFTSVGGELKDLPAAVTYVDVGDTGVGGELKDLPASVTYVDVYDTSVVGELKDLPAAVTYVDVGDTGVGGELKDLPASVTHVNVRDTSVVGELKDLPASVTYVDVGYTSVGGELKDLPASVTYVNVGVTSVVGGCEDLPASVTYAVLPSGAVCQ